MTATTFTIDDRPLTDRLKEAVDGRKAARAVGKTATTLGGAAVGAGLGYLNLVVAVAIYGAIGVPAWLMTIVQWSGYIGIAYLGLFGAWLGYASWG